MLAGIYPPEATSARWYADDYGATADGSTDSTVAIQAAIDAAYAAGGGIVELSRGTYIVTNQGSSECVNLKARVTLVGQGMGVTIIKLGDNENAHVLIGRGHDHIRLRDFTVDGNKANQGYGSANPWRGIYFVDGSHDQRIIEVEVKNVIDHGFHWSPGNGHRAFVGWCIARDCGSQLHADNDGPGGTGFTGGKHAKFVGCYASGCWHPGFKSSLATWIACTVENCLGSFETGFGDDITVTTSAASDDTVDTTTAHGFAAGDPIEFMTLTGGSGITVGVRYYVIASGLTSTSFKFSTTLGGSAFDFTTDITAATVRDVPDSGASFVDCQIIDCGTGYRHQGAGVDLSIYGGLVAGCDTSGVTILNTAKKVTIRDVVFRNNGRSTAGGWGTFVRDSVTGLDGISIMSSGSTGPADILIDGCSFYDDQHTPTMEYAISIQDDGSNILIGSGNRAGRLATQALTLESAAQSDSIRIEGFPGYGAYLHDTTGASVTGTTDATDLVSLTIPAFSLHNASVIRVKAGGTVTGTAGTKVIRFFWGGSSTIVSSQSAGETQQWAIDATITFMPGPRQVARVDYSENGGTSSTAYIWTNVALSSDQIIKFTGLLGDASDTITQTMMTVTTER